VLKLFRKVSVESRLRAGRPGSNSQQEQWWNVFLFVTASRTALEPTQPPNQWVK